MRTFMRMVFRLTLELYPRHFREEHGEALLRTMDDQIARARSTGGTLDLIWAMVTEWWTAVAGAVNVRRASTLRRADTLTSSASEIRYAIRGLLRHPGFSVGAVSLLAVGIAANTVMFSVINAYLVRPLPWPDADRLVSVETLPPDAPRERWQTVPRNLSDVDWPRSDAVIEDFVSWDIDDFTIVGSDGPERVSGAWVTPSYFGITGVRPALGRLISEADVDPAAPAVAVLSHGLWQRRFGGDPNVIGRTISAYSGDRPLETEVMTVVGVMPEDYWFVNSAHDVLAPLRSTRVPYMLRLQPGVTPADAAAHLAGIAQSALDGVDASWQPHVVHARAAYVAQIRPLLLVIGTTTLLVLLIACGNVANLLLVRSLDRGREWAVRRALGADAVRIGRQVLAEGGVLAVAAGALGVAVAWLASEALAPVIEQQLRVRVPGGLGTLILDWRVLAVALGLTTLTGLLFSLIPVVVANRTKLASTLVSSGRGSSDTSKRQLLRNLLIGAEVAGSLAVLVVAALMVRSALYIDRLDLGFESDNVITANITLRMRSYPEPAQRSAFADEVREQIGSLPGVESMGLYVGFPFRTGMGLAAVPEGALEEDGPPASWFIVGPGYLPTMRIPLQRGRLFDSGDRADAERVVVISEALAKRLWPNEDPIGRRIRPAGGEDWYRIIGVSGETRQTLTGDDYPDAFIAYHQHASSFMFIVARTTGDPEAIVPAMQASILSLDPTQPLSRVATMAQLVEQNGARPRFLAWLLAGFGFFAVTLSVFGLYSVIAYAVRQRRRDVAIRIAFGARRGHVVGTFVRAGSIVISIGLILGLFTSVALARTLAAQLHGVTTNDPWAYAGATMALAAAALVAVWVPALRAARTDPMQILRED